MVNVAVIYNDRVLIADFFFNLVANRNVMVKRQTTYTYSNSESNNDFGFVLYLR